MKKLIALSIASASIAIGAIPALAGIPESESGSEAKWQRVHEGLLIDIEDVEIKRDQIRFWIESIAVGNDVMSTQGDTSYKAKYRIRCGDFHSRLDAVVPTVYGGYIQRGNWNKITTKEFGHTLASNFCYLTKTPGYTPEPIVHVWQERITAEIKKQITQRVFGVVI